MAVESPIPTALRETQYSSQEPVALPGDLEGRSSEELNSIFNHVAELQLKETANMLNSNADPQKEGYYTVYGGIIEKLGKAPSTIYANDYVEYHGLDIDTGLLPYSVKEKIETHYQNLKDAFDYLNTPENVRKADAIKEKYKQADELFSTAVQLPENPTEEEVERFNLLRIATRQATTEGTHRATDFDGTLTTNPTEYLYDIPAGQVHESLMEKAGHDALVPTNAMTGRFDILEKLPEAYRQSGREDKTIRPGVFKFVNNPDKLTIMSASMLESVQGPLDNWIANKYIDRSDIQIFAVTPASPITLFKSLVIMHLAIENPELGLRIHGDGGSDINTVKSQDIVTGYHAFHGSKYAAELSSANAPYVTYKSFEDVNRHNAQIDIAATKIRESNFDPQVIKDFYNKGIPSSLAA